MNFSFISPAYNSSKYILYMLNSIPKQYAYEIIVCDDGSTDDTLEILKNFQNTCPQLQILVNEENKGASFSYNRLLTETSGDYVIIIDSDDMLLPTITNVLDLVDGKYDIYYYDMLTKIGEQYTIRENNYRIWPGQFKVIRRSLIGDAIFTTRSDYAGDSDFTNSLLRKNPSVFFSEIFAYWYNHPRENSETDLYKRRLK